MTTDVLDNLSDHSHINTMRKKMPVPKASAQTYLRSLPKAESDLIAFFTFSILPSITGYTKMALATQVWGLARYVYHGLPEQCNALNGYGPQSDFTQFTPKIKSRFFREGESNTNLLFGVALETKKLYEDACEKYATAFTPTRQK